MKTIFNILILSYFTILFLSCSPSLSDYDLVVDVQIDTLKTTTISDTNIMITLKNPIYKSIDFDIINISDSIIFIDFDYSTFVNQKGYTYQILSGRTTYGKMEDIQRIIVVPKGAKYSANFLPKELTQFRNNEYETFPVFSNANKGENCFLNIAYHVGDKTQSVNYLKIPMRIVRVMKYYSGIDLLE